MNLPSWNLPTYADAGQRTRLEEIVRERRRAETQLQIVRVVVCSTAGAVALLSFLFFLAWATK